MPQAATGGIREWTLQVQGVMQRLGDGVGVCSTAWKERPSRVAAASLLNPRPVAPLVPPHPPALPCSHPLHQQLSSLALILLLPLQLMQPSRLAAGASNQQSKQRAATPARPPSVPASLQSICTTPTALPGAAASTAAAAAAAPLHTRARTTSCERAIGTSALPWDYWNHATAASCSLLCPPLPPPSHPSAPVLVCLPCSFNNAAQQCDWPDNVPQVQNCGTTGGGGGGGTSQRPAPSPPISRPSPSPPPRPPLPPRLPMYAGYSQAWSEPWCDRAAACAIAKMPSYVRYVYVSFMRPGGQPLAAECCPAWPVVRLRTPCR